jgi:threonine dehydratase
VPTDAKDTTNAAVSAAAASAALSATPAAAVTAAPTGLWEPTFRDVVAARRVVDRYLRRTPFLRPAALGRELGLDVYLKCENLQPTGAFKVRGGVNLFAHSDPVALRRGVVTASTGNHGQSIAFAGRAFGVPVTICVPERANPFKVRAMEGLGATVLQRGANYDECVALGQAWAAGEGLRYVSATDEPYLIAGVGTAYLEMLEDEPELDVFIVPLGGGSNACGACIAAKAINPAAKVIAVQASGAPAFHNSWKTGEMVSTPSIATFADGLATRSAYELPFAILRRLLDDVILVSDEEIAAAVVTLMDTTHQLAEGAGAAPVAAAHKLAGSLRGRKVGLMLSGGNITLEAVRSILAGRVPG